MKNLACLIIVILGLAACSVNDTADWQKVQSSNDPNVLYQYISSHPKSAYSEIASAKIDSLDWELATKSNKIIEIENYYYKHPQGKHAAQAKALLTDAVDKAIARETPGSYQIEWPDNPVIGEMYRQKVRDLKKLEEADCSQAITANTPDKYKAFLSKWPGSPRVPDIEQRLRTKQEAIYEATWKRVRGSKSIDEYEAFVRDYPDTKYHSDAVTALQELKKDRDQRLAAEAEARARLLQIVEEEQMIIAGIRKNGIGKRFVIPNLPGKPPDGTYGVFPHGTAQGVGDVIVPGLIGCEGGVNTGVAIEFMGETSFYGTLARMNENSRVEAYTFYNPKARPDSTWVVIKPVLPNDHVYINYFDHPLLSEDYARMRYVSGQPVEAQNYALQRFSGAGG